MGRFDERWVDADAGPVVRSYAVVRGRTRPRGEALDLVTLLHATGIEPPRNVLLSREDHRMLALCARPAAVADLASDLNLPLGVVKVIAGELLYLNLLQVNRQGNPSPRPDRWLLERVLEGLKAL